MSYSLIDIPKENYTRVVTNADPLYVNMGALSAADATTLTVGVVVGAFVGVAAALTFEESYDGGDTWINVTGISADTIGGTGTFKIKVTASQGPLSPLVRLKVLPDAATTLYLTSMFRTFVQSSTMVARDISVAGLGFATEATQLTVATNTGTIATNTTAIAAWAKDSGASSATTLRTVLATRHEAVGTPLATRLSDGTDFITTGAIAAAQKTVATATKALDTVSFMLGWDTVTHREVLLDTTGSIRLSSADITSLTSGNKPIYASAYVPVIHNFAVTGITAGVYTPVIPVVSAKPRSLRYLITNSSGAYIQVAVNSADFCVVPPSGSVSVDIEVNASTLINVTSDINVSTGKLTISAFV